MQVTFIQSGMTFNQAQREYKRIYDRLMNPDPTEAVKRVADAWSVSYRQEGSSVGGWASLAQQTINERARLGFSSGPILVRENGLYNTSIAFFQRGRSGSASHTSSYGHRATTRADLSIVNGVATMSVGGEKVINQFGDPSHNLPARPFWFSNSVAQRGARDGVIEWIIKEVIT